MQRLDMLMREGKAPADLSRKVDDMLKQETRSFFCRVSAANAKRWSQALQRWELDTDAVLHEAKDKVLYNPDTSSARKAKITSRDLDLEELRLEEEYNRNWLRHEGFHLQEAFLSQQRKLSKEWDLYRAQLNDATLAKKKAILGANYASYIETNGLEATLTAASGEDQRFHHPEKQKSLIHTAPVIVPKLDGQGKSSKLAAGSAVRAVRSGKEDAVVQAEVRRSVFMSPCATSPF